eukprot:2390467-Amphidinium_carterae.1
MLRKPVICVGQCPSVSQKPVSHKDALVLQCGRQSSKLGMTLAADIRIDIANLMTQAEGILREVDFATRHQEADGLTSKRLKPAAG